MSIEVRGDQDHFTIRRWFELCGTHMNMWRSLKSPQSAAKVWNVLWTLTDWKHLQKVGQQPFGTNQVIRYIYVNVFNLLERRRSKSRYFFQLRNLATMFIRVFAKARTPCPLRSAHMVTNCDCKRTPTVFGEATFCSGNCCATHAQDLGRVPLLLVFLL